MKKMPAVTLPFGVMKICATTLGETSGDLLTKFVAKHGLGLGSQGSLLLLLLLGLLVALVACTTLRPQPAEPVAAKEPGDAAA